MPIDDLQRRKVIYPFLRRTPRPVNSEGQTITVTNTELEFVSIGGPFSSASTRTAIMISAFRNGDNHIIVIPQYSLISPPA